MKTLVFSDTHLSDRFEEKKFLFLKKLIESVDHVIINGDFWDGHLISFDTFINSKWNKLFPLLKSKKTVYIYGNHDRREFSDERVSLFSAKQYDLYELKNGKLTYVLEHGNHKLPSIDERFPLPEIVFRWATRSYTFLEGVLTRSVKRTTRFWGAILNNKLKRRYVKGQFAIFGHTHYAEFDPQHNFANTGFIQHGLAQYIFIENGLASPREEWYE